MKIEGALMLLLVISGVQSRAGNGEANGLKRSNAEMQMRQKVLKLAKEMNETVKEIKETAKPVEGIVDKTVRANFMSTLFLMANASAVTGAAVARASATVIRGFIQDSFNLASIGFYLPRLIFLDGPTQFIEILRLVRANQIRLPRDIDEAIDTLINFAAGVREAQITHNLLTPFLSFFPNVFRGAELLSTEVVYGVFSWLGPLGPSDISFPAIEGLWNRWDTKTSTTTKPRKNQPLFTEMKVDDPKRISLG